MWGLLTSTSWPAAADFYVDPDYASATHDGSAAAPWTQLDASPTGGPWTAINHALATGDVTIYFSARAAIGDSNQLSPYGVNVARTDTSSHRLTLDGRSRYNADDHRPAWSTYAGSRRFEIHYAYPISAYLPGTNQDRVTIRGFKAVGGFGGRGGQALVYWGGSHVLIEDSEFLHDPAAKHGACVQFGYAWSQDGARLNGGCTDIIIRHNVIHDTFGEGIYIGGSGNARDPATGLARPAHSHLLIEGNVIYNTGVRGAEGDGIDLKDGLSDVTVRDNLCHSTHGGNATGISSLSTFTAEGNVIYNTGGHGVSCGTYWGSGFRGVVLRHNLLFKNGKCGIYLSSDAGKTVESTLIERNTIVGNHGAGISVGVNRGGSINRLVVRANILVGNAPGLGGYGHADHTIVDNDLYANQPDYASPFRAADAPALARQNFAFDPQFTDPENPPGPDGKFFTADDGFLPRAAPPGATADAGPDIGYL